MYVRTDGRTLPSTAAAVQQCITLSAGSSVSASCADLHRAARVTGTALAQELALAVFTFLSLSLSLCCAALCLCVSVRYSVLLSCTLRQLCSGFSAWFSAGIRWNSFRNLCVRACSARTTYSTAACAQHIESAVRSPHMACQTFIPYAPACSSRRGSAKQILMLV